LARFYRLSDGAQGARGRPLGPFHGFVAYLIQIKAKSSALA